jgi:FkbM family methyltransferase
MEYEIAHNEYGTYCVPVNSKHRICAQTILSGSVYEPKTINFILNNCIGGDIVHAGAYFGDFLPALSKACWKTGEVWAFEPNPDNYACAQGTVFSNKLENVRLMVAALGEERGTAPLLSFDEKGSLGGGSRIVEDVSRIGTGMYYKVAVHRLDDIVPEDRKVSLIHLDVEGHEWKALKGAQRIIEQYKPTLVLEGNMRAEYSIDDVLNLGYELVKSFHGNLAFRRK